jgi:hypothetical protein
VAATYHPLNFAELLFAEKLKDFVYDSGAKADVVAQLDQGHFPVQVQNL